MFFFFGNGKRQVGAHHRLSLLWGLACLGEESRGEGEWSGGVACAYACALCFSSSSSECLPASAGCWAAPASAACLPLALPSFPLSLSLSLPPLFGPSHH